MAAVENNLRFMGQYYDQVTSLHYNWHRYYNPTEGSYQTADPIGLFGGTNPYAYTINNPINAVDPLGLFERWDSGRVVFENEAVQIIRQTAGNTTRHIVLKKAIAIGGGVAVGAAAAFIADIFFPPSAGDRSDMIFFDDDDDDCSTPQVTQNKINGDAFRDEIASLFRMAGYTVDTEVPYNTPFGPRVIDIVVSKDGEVIGGIECKTGGSRYHASQRAKDKWIEQKYGLIVNLVRDR